MPNPSQKTIDSSGTTTFSDGSPTIKSQYRNNTVESEESKLCSGCNKDLPLSVFHVKERHKSGQVKRYEANCKACSNEKKKQRNKKRNPKTKYSNSTMIEATTKGILCVEARKEIGRQLAKVIEEFQWD